MNDEKFLPTPIRQIDEILESFINSAPLARNIAYNIQYCQYLKHLYHNTSMTSVIATQLFKSYIVRSISIIEAILYSLLQNNGMIQHVTWEDKGQKISKNIDKRTKIEVHILKKTEDKQYKAIKFISILEKAKKLEIFKNQNSLFEDLKNLNKLRNKIHIYNIQNFENSDYNQFTLEDFKKMIQILNKFILLLVNKGNRT